MKLYKIVFEHYSPKDSETGIKEFVVADNDEQVLDYIGETHAYWTFDDDEYSDDRSAILAECGELNNDDKLTDLYYGQTLWGWEVLGDLSDSDYNVLNKTVGLKNLCG